MNRPTPWMEEEIGEREREMGRRKKTRIFWSEKFRKCTSARPIKL